MVTTRRDPTLSATTAAIGVKTAATIANGRVCMPAESVEYPLTNWKYWVIRKMNPKRQKNATEMESAPPLNRGILNTRTSSSGPSVRSSSSVKAVNSTAATAKHARVPVDAQPHCGPSMMPSTNDGDTHGREQHTPDVEGMLRHLGEPWDQHAGRR